MPPLAYDLREEMIPSASASSSEKEKQPQPDPELDHLWKS